MTTTGARSVFTVAVLSLMPIKAKLLKMKIQAQWIEEWKKNLEPAMTEFLLSQELIEKDAPLSNKRFLARSIIPHVKKYQELFNRKGELAPDKNYWKKISDSPHFLTAYFLAYMPANLVRVASVLGELERLGFQFSTQSARVLELGAGPASAAAGWCEVSRLSPDFIPKTDTIALVEKDRKALELGAEWIRHITARSPYAPSVQTFHRTIDWARGLLPKTAPEFDVILTSYFLNESTESTEYIAEKLFYLLDDHLSPEGIWIGVEPALKAESRKLLEIRKHLIARILKTKSKLKILLPCLGHQSCGALEKAGDWCHEEVTWWRPPYLKAIDEMASIDRKSLPYSYLVIAKSDRERSKILPKTSHPKIARLVSPTHTEGSDLEFHLCDQTGKRKARWKTDNEIGRGDLISIQNERGDQTSRRIDKASVI
ncbi:MAG: hypothetical protein KA715_13680 [Xanthomonadaceae bacterium]|nr:hypothetical protein [Xanthomonadaceae bacterium]